MKRRLALTVDGRITYCTAPPDKIGMGRCNHVEHQKDGESVEEFVRRSDHKKTEQSKRSIEEFEIALELLQEKLAKSKNRIEIKAIGGFALMYHKVNKNRLTMDIDTVTKDYNEKVQQHILEVSKELGLPKDWLNNENVIDNDTEIVEAMIDAYWIKQDYGLENIDFKVASIETLTNAKIIAVDSHKESGRLQDIPDLLDLLEYQGIETVQQFDQKYPDVKFEYPETYVVINKHLKGGNKDLHTLDDFNKEFIENWDFEGIDSMIDYKGYDYY